MLKVETKRLSDNKITHSHEVQDQQEADAYVLKVESKLLTNGNNPFGWKERLKVKSEASAEEIASAIETIPAVTQVIPAVPESVDSEGNVIPAQDERVEEVSPEMIKLPKTYEIIVTDISSQIAQESINKQAKDLLASTDWKVLRHKDQVDLGVPTSMTEQEYQDLLQARQAARDSIVE